jgi:hypothetical protein
MEVPTEGSSVLLLERPGAATGAPPDVSGLGSSWHHGHEVVPEEHAGKEPAPDPAFRSPGLALLAAFSILEGYKWLGVIPPGDSRLSTLVFGGVGALVFAALMPVVVLALTRPGADERRPLSHRLVVLATVMVMAATVVHVAATGDSANYALGVSDLVLASTAAGAFIVGEGQKRRAGRSDAHFPDGGGATDRALPVG